MELIKASSVVLLFLALSGWMIAVWRLRRCWRTSLIVSATFWGIWVAATTELLSYGSMLTRSAVASGWLLASFLSWSLAIAASKYPQLFATFGSSPLSS